METDESLRKEERITFFLWPVAIIEKENKSIDINKPFIYFIF